VISACDGQEALDICTRQPDIKLIITDVIMPRLKGPDFVARLRATRPDMRVIYISGDIGDTPRAALGDDPLLTKPFTTASLAQLVGKALAR
jgi:two-component system, cell cycle sensor histidine kinase and response regulator CckA